MDVAILIDAAYLSRSLRPILRRFPSAEDILDFAARCLWRDNEHLFRIYYYDCPPYERRAIHPLTREPLTFAHTEMCRAQKALQHRLAESDGVAFRAGVLQFGGWQISERTAQELLKYPRQLLPCDLRPRFRQKRVDIKIGLDVAWLSARGIVGRIVLVAADTDFIPAMKLARREGVQIVIASPSRDVPVEMRVHADAFRWIDYGEIKRMANRT